MKLKLLKFAATTAFSLLTLAASAKANAEVDNKTAYSFEFKTLGAEEPMPLSQYKGKVLLIVNTASQCGFTGQYEGLQKLYDKYKDKGLVVIGVPSNDFGKQEPGSGSEIADFCKLNYGVTFPMAAKEQVSGDGAHPFYKWAKAKLGFGTAPKWNFHKYLVDKNGSLITHFNSTTTPNSESLVKAIESNL